MHPYKLYVYILYNFSSGLVWRGNSNTYLYRHRENWRKSNKKKSQARDFFPIIIAIVRESLFSCLHRITSPLPENPTPLRSHSLIALYTKILHAYSFRLFLGLSLSLPYIQSHSHNKSFQWKKTPVVGSLAFIFERLGNAKTQDVIFVCVVFRYYLLYSFPGGGLGLCFYSTKRTDCCPPKKVKWAFSTIQTILHCIASWMLKLCVFLENNIMPVYGHYG